MEEFKFVLLVIIAHFMIVNGDVWGIKNTTQRPSDIFLKPYADFLNDVYQNLRSGSSQQCSKHTEVLLELASKGDEQALRFFDANGKPVSGELEGGLTFLGFHSECINSKIAYNSSTIINGKYCLVPVDFRKSENKNIIPRASFVFLRDVDSKAGFGLCIPSSCSNEDVFEAANFGIINRFNNGSQVQSPQCSKVSNFSEDTLAVSVLTVFLILLIFIISATFFDWIQHRAKLSAKPVLTQSTELLCDEISSSTGSTLRKCFLAFSMRENAAKILAFSKTSGNISSLNGLRLFSMLLIVFLHTYAFSEQDLFFINRREMLKFPKEFMAQIIANGTLAVDTFYYISGLLLTYVTLKSMEKNNGKISYLYFYVHRYVRLTPLLFLVILFCAGLLKYLGSGPNWAFSILMYDDWCQKNWWINILYLHNFINTNQMCLAHSWYLATDMQFYIVTPLILIPLYFKFWMGAVVISLFFTGTVLTSGILTALHDYPAIPYMNSQIAIDLMNDYNGKVYIRPYCRMGPYLIGILAGYLLLKKKEIILKKWQIALGWTVSTVLLLTVSLGLYQANQGDLPTIAASAAYSALARSVWALGIAWITLACSYGYGGFVNSILSWGPLIPFSRLTYCAYLIHPVVMAVFYGSIQTNVHFSHLFIAYLFIGNLVITYVLSFFLTIWFESPFMGLEKAIMSRNH